MTIDRDEERYQIEVELAELRAFRMVMATQFSESARALHNARQAKAGGWRLRVLRRKAEEFHRDYELACAAVIATEMHHYDAGTIGRPEALGDSFARDRLERHRSHADDDASYKRMLVELLFELRGLRDGVSPPKADALDIHAAHDAIRRNRE